MKKTVFLLIVIIGFVSCSKKETNLDKYLTHSDKFEKKKVTDPNGNFSLYIPKDWEFKTEYNDERYNFLVFSDIYPKSDETNWEYIFNQCMISIFKFRDSLDFKEQNERFISEGSLDSGETNFLNYPSYFGYYHKNPSRGMPEKRKEMLFVVKNEQKENIFYYISLMAFENENQQENMSMMLHCLQTFEILK